VLVRLRTRRQLFNLATQRSEAGPVMAGERIPFVDVLRGMAMLFILVENLAILFPARLSLWLGRRGAARADRIP
jgi:uncharacterized membrane protein YeiB